MDAPNHTYLTKIVPSKNQQRYYSLRVDPDLFGCWSLVRQWGRLDADGGTLRFDSYPTEDEALRKLDELTIQKQNRGYDLM